MVRPAAADDAFDATAQLQATDQQGLSRKRGLVRGNFLACAPGPIPLWRKLTTERDVFMMERDFYRIRDFVHDFDAIAAEFAERSRALERRARIRSDIAYGPRPRETLDLLLPEKQSTDAPLHVFVHGGYWRSGETADYRFVAEPVLAAGGLVALVEYDLMPGQRLPTLIDQVRRAVRWL